MDGITIQVSGVQRLAVIDNADATIGQVVKALNQAVRRFDALGNVERLFEFARPVAGCVASDFAKDFWNGIGRIVVIVERDGSDPGTFWVHLSRYPMPPDCDGDFGYTYRLHHLATAKVLGANAAWGIAALIASSLDI